MLDSLKQSATSAAKSTGVFLLGAFLVVVGVGFLTSAIWLALAQTYGAPAVATIIGSLYIVMGTIVFAVSLLLWGRRPSGPFQQSHGPVLTPMQNVIVAFMQGLDAAASVKRGRGHGGT